MYNFTKPTRAKQGAISIEISLSLALSVVILTVVLSLFSANIEKIAEASGLYNYFFHRSEKVTTYNDQKYDATKTQVNVQLVADQGLTYYIDNALATIDKYKETPPETLSQTEDLARAAAVAELYNKLATQDAIDFYNDYKISIKEKSDYGYVKVENKKLSYTYNAQLGTSTEEQYNLAKYILNTNNQFN
jgi:hypothetical protein